MPNREPTLWTSRVLRRRTWLRTAARTFVALFCLAVLASIWVVVIGWVWGEV